MPARRSCLSVPGSSPRMLAKAAALPADEVVIDLEDAVAPDAKDGARAAAVTALAAAELSGRTVAVRVNGLATPWGERDVAAVAERPGAASTLVVPKAESAADVDAVARMLDRAEGGSTRLGLQALVETAAGLQHAGEIAAASPRMESLIIGYADLRASLGRPPDPDEPPTSWEWAQETVLVAARAAGIQAIDGPHLQIRDDAGLRAWAAHVRARGYDGKWAIHPAQLATLNDTFAPTAAELDRAGAIVAALRQAEGDGGHGAVELEGEMIDEASRKHARQIVARGQAAGLVPAGEPAEAGAP